MAEKCVKCTSNITLPKEGVKCSDCPIVCHVRCVGVVTRNKRWKCDSCVLECSSSSSKMSDPGSTNSSILEAINAFRRENNEKWECNKNTLTQLITDVNGVKSEMSDLINQFHEIKQTCTVTSESVDLLKNENRRLSEELTMVKQHVAELEQHTRKNNILISGVPVTGKENVIGVLNNIAKALQLQFYVSEIAAAHRLQGRRGDPRPPSIVVSFVSRLIKEDWLVARRRKRSLTAKELHNTFPDTQIFLNEQLTPLTRAIFNGARDLMKEKKLSSVWTSDCRVMARLSPQHRPFRVRDLQHVAQLSETTSADPSTPQPPSPLAATN